jgi:hypothetical protein
MGDTHADIQGEEMSAAALKVLVHGVPGGARLSAGRQDDCGTWELTPAELGELHVISAVDYNSDIVLTVRVVGDSADEWGQTLTVSIRMRAGMPAPLVSEAANDVPGALDFTSAAAPLDGLYRAISPLHFNSLSFV